MSIIKNVAMVGPFEHMEVSKVFPEKCSGTSFVASVYSYGTVRVSDTNFILVIDDSANLADLGVLKCMKETNLRGGCNDVIHFIYKSQIPEIVRLFNFINPKHEYGEKIRCLENPSENQDRQLLTLIDACAILFSAILVNVNYEGVTDTNHGIRLMKNFCQVIESYRLLNKQELPPMVLGFEEEISYYERRYASRNEDTNKIECRRLLQLSLGAMISLVTALDSYILQNFWRDYDANEHIVKGVYRSSKYAYIGYYGELSPCDIMGALRKETGLSLCLLPYSFIYPMIKYTESKGVFSESVKENLEAYDESFVTFADIERAFRDRTSILNKYPSAYEEIFSAWVGNNYSPAGNTLNNYQIQDICQRMKTKFMDCSR